jgi:serine phosphatase RsbU (regulator of sigma subunit)
MGLGTSIAFAQSLKGRILDGKKPLSNAKIYLKGYETASTTTDTQGNFQLDLPSDVKDAAEIRFYVVKQGSKIRQGFQIKNNASKFVEIALKETEDLPLKAGNPDETEAKNSKKTEPVKDDKIEKVEVSAIEEINEEIQEIKKMDVLIGKMESIPFLPISKVLEAKKDTAKQTVLDKNINKIDDVIRAEERRMDVVNEKIKQEIQQITEILDSAKDLSKEDKTRYADRLRKLQEDLDARTTAFLQKQSEIQKQLVEAQNRLEERTQYSAKVLYSLTAGLILVSLVAVGLYLLSQRRKKQRDLIFLQKNEIEKQRDEIELQKKQIEIQASELEDKNKKMSDSIRAALLIQQSILPRTKALEDDLGEYFVLYKPKDIVSGDFYWSHRIEDKVFLAVVDCTGHGVPGAFMSMIGHSLLNEILLEQKIYDPAEILEELSIRIFSRLNTDKHKTDDGMDIALCRLEKKEGTPHLTFAAAKRPLLLYREGKIETYKGTRRSIGVVQSMDKDFTNTPITLQKGDVVYLSTDGYADAASPDRKTFGTGKLLQILTEIAEQPMNTQKFALQKALSDHCADEELRDDITLLGFRI